MASPFVLMSILPLANTRFTGKRFLYLDSVGSTNTFCLKNEELLDTAGLVVYADRQHAGRGRMGRAWEQGEGVHLFSSFVIHPELPTNLIPSITLCAGISVHEVLTSLGAEDCSLKWPNDVLLSARKVCGILCESRSSENSIRVVVGIGINISGTSRQFSRALSDRSGTLEMFGVQVSRDELLVKVCYALDGVLVDLHEGRQEDIFHKWEEVSESIGRDVRFVHEGEEKRGRITGLDGLGRLLVETAAGEIMVVVSGEVEFV